LSEASLKVLFEQYLYASSDLEKIAIVTLIIDQIFKRGFDTKALEFLSMHYDEKAKQKLIEDIFNEIETANEMRKYEIIDTLGSFLIETTPLIRDQILPVYIKNLSDKENFKLVFTTLKIFTSKWDYFNDDLKKILFKEFLVILDNPFDFFIEEGIYEITKIILNSKSSVEYDRPLFSGKEKKEYMKKLILIALKNKGDSFRAAIDSINQILSENPNFIDVELYQDLFRIFKRLNRKVSLFYPAKRQFIKSALSFLNLILFFESKFYEDELGTQIKKLLTKISGKIDHADAKYLLELIQKILKNTKNIPKAKILEPTFIILRDLNNKRDRLEEYTKNILEEIFSLLWPLIDDNSKDFFLKENNFKNSRL